MRDNRDLVSAIAAREKGRSRLRAATATVGLAGLASAGVIAWHLPASAHSTTASTSGSAARAQSGTSASATRSRGETESDDGSRQVSSSGAASTGTGSGVSSHATSGGS